MDFIISFFRDTLDGTTYVIVCSVSAVLLCACIGYLADKKTRKKAEKARESSEVEQPVTSPVENIVSPQVDNTIPVMPPETESQAIPTTIPTVPNSEQPVEQIEENTIPTPMPAPQMPVSGPEVPPQPQTPEQPIFPPVDNSGTSPVGITNTPVEATAPTPSFEGMPQQNQSVFQPPEQPAPQQVNPTPEENINNQVAPTATLENPTGGTYQVPDANVNPNLNIPAGERPPQPEGNVALPNEQQPTMEQNLDMPQMPTSEPEQLQQTPAPQAETLDNISNTQGQAIENQIINNQVAPTATLENPVGVVSQAPEANANPNLNIPTGELPQQPGNQNI